MNPWKVSAQFAAFVWFTNKNKGRTTHAQAMRFARENWVAFLPSAHEGVGRLLIRVARLQPDKDRQGQRRTRKPVRKNVIREWSEVG